MAELQEDKHPETFMVYTNTEGKTVYLGLNGDDEPVVVLITDGEYSPEGQRMIIRSSNDDTPEDGRRMHLRSEGGMLPGGEGKYLYNKDGELITPQDKE
jgi:hypothetical protein